MRYFRNNKNLFLKFFNCLYLQFNINVPLQKGIYSLIMYIAFPVALSFLLVTIFEEVFSHIRVLLCMKKCILLVYLHFYYLVFIFFCNYFLLKIILVLPYSLYILNIRCRVFSFLKIKAVKRLPRNNI